MKKNIIVIYPNSFPISGAATNRIISLCRAMIERGNFVKIIITRPTEKKNSQVNFKQNGSFKEIEYEYSTRTLIWPDKIILKILYWLLGFGMTCFKVFKENKRRKIDIIVSAATYGYFENFVYFVIAKFIKAKFVHTIDEYPWVLINYNQYSALYRRFYLNYYYRLFDGFIVITKTLLEYYKSISPPRAKFIHIPMTVEFDRFDIQVPKPKEDYIAYCGGDKTGTKDNVDILVKAFNIVKDDFPKLKLYIIGKAIHPSIPKLVNELALNNRIIFLGFVSYESLPSYLLNAKTLCLSKGNNLQNQGCFPTKLGEYLATGNPVVVTRVGEIPNYLKDNESAFIAEPNNIDSFASKLRYVLDHPLEAKIIGENGKKVATLFFNYKNYSVHLDNFLINI